MKKTTHSEYGKLQSVYIKHARDAFESQEQLKQQWHALNYLQEPHFPESLEEYSTFEKIVVNAAEKTEYFNHDPSVSIDSIYCRDASLFTDYGVILCRMGKEARIPEPSAAALIYEQHGVKVLGCIEAPGTLEGGDLTWIDETTLAVGRTYRTNDEGIRQLRSLLEPYPISIIQVDLPHYKGESDVFHLMSILSPVDKDLAVVYSPLMPVSFRDLLLQRGYTFIEVPDEEFESMGCNVLALGPRRCVMVDGNPVTQKRLEHAGVEVMTYKGEEISVKGGGGPTCLTRPAFRYI